MSTSGHSSGANIYACGHVTNQASRVRSNGPFVLDTGAVVGWARAISTAMHPVRIHHGINQSDFI